MTTSVTSDAKATGQRVVRMEAEALSEVERRIGDGFVAAVNLIAASTGRVIVSGIGKSGHVARKGPAIAVLRCETGFH